MRVKLQHFVQMAQKVRGAVVAGIKMKVVSDALSQHLVMQRLCAHLKAKLILIAAVEVDCLTGQLRPVNFCQPPCVPA